MAKNKFFVVWDGKEPGIYHSWDQCKMQIHGYANAKYMGFATEVEARQAFLSPYWDYIGKNAKMNKTKVNIDSNSKKPILESISVDAACSGNPGKMEYRGVYTKTGEEIFRQGPFDEGTNNIGEFLAIVHALALQKQKNTYLPIYSDSTIAINWIRTKKSKTKLEKNDRNTNVFELIERAERWLLINDYNISLLKWETKHWGEIPADFGRK
jgi:ribonuclease HI